MPRHAARAIGASILFALIVTVVNTEAPKNTALAQSASNTSALADNSGSDQTAAYKASLQAQLDAINAQIAQQQTILSGAEAQSNSLQNTIAILNAQIKSAKLAIQARDLTIQQLTSSISDKQDTIFGLNTQLNGEKDSLAGIMREKQQLESDSLVVVMLSSESLSQFFSDLDTFDSIDKSLQASFTQISSTTVATQAEKDALETQLEQESQLRQVQALQEQQVEASQTQENKLLAETKGQETAYQKLITANQKTAAQIRTELFQLNGSVAIPFGKALDYANAAAAKTGIRPAFLLGIIKEESDLGNNVGTGSYSVDMNPTRDVPVFLAITQSLGLNPATMPVSAKAWYGWGGAMGPAQFIPSTWALYAGYVKPDYHYDSSKDRVGALTGDTPPNPWIPQDAFMASALYLTDDNADAQTPAAEFKAAMCYLAGCGNAGNKSLQFYGNQVLCNELQFQQDIDTITGSHDAAAMQSNSLYYGQC
jgi:membrane-bound lytic murein transglycosylase B